MDSDLAGRVRNTSLPRSKTLLPFFEAVVNSIQALEESKRPLTEARIEIEIVREFVLHEGKTEIGPKNIRHILITDNGPGFNDDNMKSFEKLDSDYKIKLGCKGFGRVLWLKAFQRSEIESVFRGKDNNFYVRNFTFSVTPGHEIEPIEAKPTTADDTETTVKLCDLRTEYACNKATENIAQGLLDHCIWYFLQPGGAPDIILKDDDKTIRLQDFFDTHCQEYIIPDHVDVGPVTFELMHIKMRNSGQKDSFVAYSANSRLVLKKKLDGQVAGFMSPMHDEKGAYSYVCFVSSKYLDERVRPERTDFDIPKVKNGDEVVEEVSWAEIENAILTAIRNHLGDDLAVNLQQADRELQAFIDLYGPQYRILMEEIKVTKDYPPCGSSSSDKEQFLHKRMLKRREALRAKGESLLKDAGEKPYEEYATRMEAYLKDVSAQNKSSLVEYVLHRKTILDILETAMSRGEKGKYSREEVIHALIMPRWKDSAHTEYDDMNLWLIDERLAFHNYLASDIPLNQMPITDSNSTLRSDLLSLQVPDAPMLVSERQLPLSAITVVELKRPMRADTDKKTPVDQAIDYIDELRSGHLTTAQGRPIQPTENIPAFCYIITDVIGKALQKMIKDFSLKPTADNLSFFGYQDGHKVYLEVITYDGLLKAAKERNHIFFQKLGLRGS
ncbi:MAG: hypothetical protein K5651_01815 [Bacteroidales bacterium]|nr:hypothetical protein [Bacteroidales bacterium]